MRWIHRLTPRNGQPADVIGAKAHGLVALQRLGLPVPAGFVIAAGACRAFLRDRRPPGGLDDELAVAVADLEAATGRTFGGAALPLAVSVRSGSSVSMPGMMSTVLDLGLTAAATTGLAAETGDARFALDARHRLLRSFGAAIADVDAGDLPVAGRGGDASTRLDPGTREIEALIARRLGRPLPDDAMAQLQLAVAAVWASWDGPRARTYRDLHGIPHDLGTAVIVQAMVFGTRDGHSGTGVAFSRDPTSGAPALSGEVLFGRQGDDVVSGTSLTRPLRDLADREPRVWAALRDALRRVEGHHRDACCLEFTFEAGDLWLLQARPGRFAGAAAVRVATELADEGVIARDEALRRVSVPHLRQARNPRLAAVDAADVLARGVGACPGVAIGRIATSAGTAARMAADGPVILVRPETSPRDMRGIAAATGIVTARGGPASHAAVVARAMGRPAVVGVAALAVADGCVHAGGRTLAEGTLIAVDGTAGLVALGDQPTTAKAGPHVRRLLAWADEVSGDASTRADAERLQAAHAALARR